MIFESQASMSPAHMVAAPLLLQHEHFTAELSDLQGAHNTGVAGTHHDDLVVLGSRYLVGDRVRLRVPRAPAALSPATASPVSAIGSFAAPWVGFVGAHPASAPIAATAPTAPAPLRKLR